jgi:hypothetical protein
MRTADQIKKEIAKKYNRDPDGWKAWMGLDKERNINWMINHDRQMWMLKEFNVNPLTTIGVGGRTKISGPKRLLQRNIMGFGVRPLNENNALDILAEDNPYLRGQKVGNLMLKIKPTPLNRLNDDFILHGPILSEPKNLDDLSYKQKQLKEKLDSEMIKIKRRDFPYLYSLYQ